MWKKTPAEFETFHGRFRFLSAPRVRPKRVPRRPATTSHSPSQNDHSTTPFCRRRGKNGGPRQRVGLRDPPAAGVHTTEFPRALPVQNPAVVTGRRYRSAEPGRVWYPSSAKARSPYFKNKNGSGTTRVFGFHLVCIDCDRSAKDAFYEPIVWRYSREVSFPVSVVSKLTGKDNSNFTNSLCRVDDRCKICDRQFLGEFTRDYR